MIDKGYRKRAEIALGRKLKSHEHVHHHSLTQLVICDRTYHGFLHRQMNRRGIPSPAIYADEGTASFNICISRTLYRKLCKIAELEMRTLPSLIRRILDISLNHLESTKGGTR